MKNLLILFVLIFMFSCQPSKWDKSNLPGSWQSIQWIQLDSGDTLDNNLVFEFDSTGRYSVDYGTEKERGKYWVAGEYLHTVEDGRAEKKVRILQLSSDSLIMEMNRAGYLEKLVLVKS